MQNTARRQCSDNRAASYPSPVARQQARLPRIVHTAPRTCRHLFRKRGTIFLVEMGCKNFGIAVRMQRMARASSRLSAPDRYKFAVLRAPYRIIFVGERLPSARQIREC